MIKRNGFAIAWCTALLLALPASALGMGISFTPSDYELLLIMSPPVLAGLVAGLWSGGRFRAWNALLTGAGIALLVLLVIFTQGRWLQFAPIIVPILLLLYLAGHMLGHYAMWRWLTRQRAR
jgi:hypothetical protein